jgi:hypothetical protein
MLDGRWVPIARDRDKAFVSYEGALLDAARKVLPRLVTYRSTQPTAMFYNAIEFDRRLLVSLDRADFDSTARFLQSVLTDSLVDAALALMPKEYLGVQPDLAGRIKQRRNALPAAAAGYYRALFTSVDLHGSDEGEQVSITRSDDGSTRIEMRSGNASVLDRVFKPGETREIRLYLHAGDDRADVRGNARSAIPLWVIGGPGTNALTDSSVVAGRARTTHFYDNGQGPSKEAVGQQDSTGYDPDTAWNRKPVVKLHGWEVPQFRDRGSRMRPTAGLSTGRGLGVVPSLGLTRVKYGFRQFPYASRMELDVKYATAISAWGVELTTDNRIENSRMFWATRTEVSQLLSGKFRGFGNDISLPEDVETRVHQTQVLVQPSIGWALGPVTEFTFGPVVKYTSTDSVAGTFIASERPYGFRRFGQAGVQLRFLHESTREVQDKSTTARFTEGPPERGLTIDASAAAYPAVWDAQSAFGSVSAVTTGHVTMPLPLRPVLAARAGGQILFGDYPYFESAFIGGSSSIRTIRRQQYAGDAALYGTLELRVPIAQFSFIFPLNTGLLGFVDAGRVYLDGKSPGGWHVGKGAGFWLGLIKPSTSLTLTFTNQTDRRWLVGTGFVF